MKARNRNPHRDQEPIEVPKLLPKHHAFIQHIKKKQIRYKSCYCRVVNVTTSSYQYGCNYIYVYIKIKYRMRLRILNAFCALFNEPINHDSIDNEFNRRITNIAKNFNVGTPKHDNNVVLIYDIEEYKPCKDEKEYVWVG